MPVDIGFAQALTARIPFDITGQKYLQAIQLEQGLKAEEDRIKARKLQEAKFIYDTLHTDLTKFLSSQVNILKPIMQGHMQRGKDIITKDGELNAINLWEIGEIKDQIFNDEQWILQSRNLENYQALQKALADPKTNRFINPKDIENASLLADKDFLSQNPGFEFHFSGVREPINILDKLRESFSALGTKESLWKDYSIHGIVPDHELASVALLNYQMATPEWNNAWERLSPETKNTYTLLDATGKKTPSVLKYIMETGRGYTKETLDLNTQAMRMALGLGGGPGGTQINYFEQDVMEPFEYMKPGTYLFVLPATLNKMYYGYISGIQTDLGDVSATGGIKKSKFRVPDGQGGYTETIMPQIEIQTTYYTPSQWNPSKYGKYKGTNDDNWKEVDRNDKTLLESYKRPGSYFDGNTLRINNLITVRQYNPRKTENKWDIGYQADYNKTKGTPQRSMVDVFEFLQPKREEEE